MNSARNTGTSVKPPAHRLSGEEIVDLVNRTVGAVLGCLPWTLERDELTQIGALALLELETSFEPEREIPFLAYVHARLRGRIIDHAWRVAGWSRSHFRTARRIADRDYAARGSSLDASCTMSHVNGQVQARPTSTESLSDESYEERGAQLPIAIQPQDPERATAHRRQRQALRGALRRLPADEAHIIRDLYVEERPYNVIGPEHGKSASWACRTHKRLLDNLREEITEQPHYVEEPVSFLLGDERELAR